jgi:flagellar motor switch protein FliM
VKKVLTQQEIDTLFSGMATARAEAGPPVTAFDFSRLDRIPKSQIRVVNALYETFLRNVSTSLAAYLRTYVSPNLASLEQISYGEFLEGLDMPTCIAYVSLRPFDGTMLIALNRSLVFSCIELLLGGEPDPQAAPTRKLTEIEKNLVANMLRVVLTDLREAWRSVADIHFEVQSLADDPHGLRVLTSAEAVVAVSIEMKLGATSSVIHMAIPSIFIKRFRDKFERLQSVQQVEGRWEDQACMSRLMRQVSLDLEVRLDAGAVTPQDLADLSVGDVLMFDHPVERPVAAVLNGYPLYVGALGATGDRLTYTIGEHASVE